MQLVIPFLLAVLSATGLELSRHEIKAVPPQKAAELLIKISDHKKTQRRNLKVLLHIYPDEGKLKNYLKHLDSLIDVAGLLIQGGESVDSTTAQVVLCMPPGFLKTLHVKEATKLVKALDYPLESYHNLYVDWFGDASFVRALLNNSVIGVYEVSEEKKQDGLPSLSSASDDEWTKSKPSQEFFTAMSPEQFAMVMAKCPDFHRGRLTKESLVILSNSIKSDLTLRKYIASVSAAFLDSLDQKKTKMPLGLRIISMLPVGILNDCNVPFHPDDAPHWTIEQLKAFKRTQSRHHYDFSKLPADRIIHLGRDQLMLAKSWSAQQLSQLTAAQWNELLVDQPGYKLLIKGVTLKSLSKITFRGAHFHLAHPSAQSFILANHRGDVPDDLLINVTNEQVRRWQFKELRGLDVLQAAHNKSLLLYIGESPDLPESKHPLYALEPSAFANLKKFPLCEHGLSLLNIAPPETMNEIMQSPQIYCYLDNIVDLVSSFDANAWINMKPDDMEALTAPVYSKVPKRITKKIYSELKPEVVVALPGHAVAQLSFFSELTAKQYAAFDKSGFSHLTAAHIDAVRLAEVPDSHLPDLGVSILDMKTNYWANMTTEQMAVIKDRLALLSPRQVAALKPDVFAKTFTPPVLSSLSSQALSMVPKEQLMALPAESRQALPEVFREAVAVGEPSSANAILPSSIILIIASIMPLI